MTTKKQLDDAVDAAAAPYRIPAPVSISILVLSIIAVMGFIVALFGVFE